MFFTACSADRGMRPEDLPTRVPSVEILGTAVVLTENAPPPGFREAVSFPEVDATLPELEGWRYVVQLEFDGIFSQTARETDASARAEVWFNQIGAARRVLVESSGELLQQPEGATYEAVRLGPDAFLVQSDVCLTNAEEDAQTASNLRAGDLVGGVESAVPTGRQQVLNGVQAWEYRFAPDAINLPAVRFADDTRVTNITGEMWVAPEFNAVVRFYANIDVENGRLLTNNLPVTGRLLLRYDLFDIGVVPNITVPFGC